MILIKPNIEKTNLLIEYHSVDQTHGQLTVRDKCVTLLALTYKIKKASFNPFLGKAEMPRSSSFKKL